MELVLKNVGSANALFWMDFTFPNLTRRIEMENASCMNIKRGGLLWLRSERRGGNVEIVCSDETVEIYREN